MEQLDADLLREHGEGKVCMISEVMSPVGRYNQIFVL